MRWFGRGLQIGAIGLLLVVSFSSPVHADGPDLKGVSFEQELDAQLPLDLSFKDERKQVVHLRDYFGRVPVILTLNYLTCSNLCPMELADLTKALAQLTFDLGKEFDVLTVSIDPHDTPVIAASKRQLSLGMYGRAGADAGWHFLTGDANSIASLTRTVGFNYSYDAGQKDYTHPLGVIVLTPQGQVSRYLYGLDFPARDLRLALAEASQNKIATPVDQVLLFCYHYDPAAGRYTAEATDFVKLGGALTVGLLGSFLFVLWKVELTPK